MIREIIDLCLSRIKPALDIKPRAVRCFERCLSKTTELGFVPEKQDMNSYKNQKGVQVRERIVIVL